MTTSSSRFGGSYSTSNLAAKHGKSTLTMRTDYLPLGSAISRQLTEAKLKTHKKKKLIDENPDEELYKFPTLGQISKMTVESNPLAKHVRNRSAATKKKQANLVEQAYGSIELETNPEAFSKIQSPMTSKSIADPLSPESDDEAKKEEYDKRLA